MNQKGFANIALIVLVVVLVGVLGYVTLVKKPATTSAPQTNEIDTTKVLILTEENLVNDLRQDLMTYQDDIKKDLNLQSQIKTIPSTAGVKEAKKIVQEYYQQGNLHGVLLVGNIPAPKIYHPDYLNDPIFSSQGFGLSDAVYQDIYNHCVYSSELDAYSYKNPGCGSTTIQSFWVGRLTPNSSQEKTVTLLKDYFRRNHLYRTGKYSFQKNTLLYLPSLNEEKMQYPQQYPKTIAGIFDNLKFFNTYNRNQVKLLVPDSGISDINYLNELKKQYAYETVIYNGHGLPTFHQQNIEPGDINNTSFFLIDLRSCSVGRFTTTDYLAGNYLFSGGLIALAASVPVFSGSEPNKVQYYLLSTGHPFYETLDVIGLGLADNVLGDPTLRMRYDLKIAGDKNASISIDPAKIVLTKSSPKTQLGIKNVGKSNLLYSITTNYHQNETPQFSGQGLFGYGSIEPVDFDSGAGAYVLAPGQKTTWDIDAASFFPFDTTPPGTYRGTMFILSNDSSKLLVRIPFEIQN